MSVLVDTGILLRAFVKADPNCGPIRMALLKLCRQNEELVVAFQKRGGVLQRIDPPVFRPRRLWIGRQNRAGENQLYRAHLRSPG